MHVAQDLHQQLVDIDVLALEAQVRQLQDCLEASGEGQLFITKVRYLAGIIGVPRLSMRLVALASRWLSNSGRIEEAILELGDLGDLDKIGLDKFEDALALLTIADLCDLSAMRKEQVLRRAAVVAACTEEELFAKFALTHHMMSTKKLDEALRIVDSIIAESRSKEGSVEAPAEALLLRWKITKSENDLRSFKAAIESSRGLPRRRCSAMLIDGGLYADAEQLLREDMDAGDLVAKLLVVDARMRSGKTDSARDLFLTIGQEQIQHESRYLYAVISAQLALFCKDERIRKLAILSIRALPASRAIDEDVQSLFRGVQGKDFTSAAPSG
jgi:hypothetical protein